MRILIRQGEGVAGITRLHHERTANRAALERNIAQAQTAPDLDSKRISYATAGGDERKLRGIPCIARGVAGRTDSHYVDDPRSSPFRLRSDR